MPRAEAKAIFELIKPIGMGGWFSLVFLIYEHRGLALSIDPKLFIEIMGSYRR
jgi:hypothetical protein